MRRDYIRRAIEGNGIENGNYNKKTGALGAVVSPAGLQVNYTPTMSVVPVVLRV